MDISDELPEGWATASLERLIAADGTFIDGDWIETKDQDPAGDVRLIQLADVGDGEYKNKSRRYLTSAKAKELDCTLLKEGDILVARMPDPLGRACIFPGEKRPCVTAVDVCIVRPASSPIDRPWLLRSINSRHAREQIESFRRGTTRGRISRTNLGTITLFVPPLAEQQRIVAKVEELLAQVNAARERLARTAALLKRFRQSVLSAACDGRLTADWRGEVSTNGDLPEAWRWAAIKTVADVRGGIQKQPKRTPKSNAYPYLRVANVLRGRLDLSDVHKMELFDGELETFHLEPQDLLIVEGNGSMAEIGRCALWDGAIADCVHQNHIIRVRARGCEPRYLATYWNSPLGAEAVGDVAVTTAGLFSLSTKKVAEMPVLIPPEKEQHEIVRRVDALFALADAIESRVAAATARAERLTQSILAKAFRGELVPTEAELARAEGRDYEPASALLARIRALTPNPSPRGRGERRGRRKSG